MRDFSTPDFLDDSPPALADAVETHRRTALSVLAAHGYSLIIPPLVEYLETLTAADEALDRKTFKMTDTVSGRTLGIRADQTPQIARYDALHTPRNGNATAPRHPRRYCYCGPVLLTHPPQPWQSREIMQLGAELFGAPPPYSDWEVLAVAYKTLSALGLADISVDLGHAGLFYAITHGLPATAQQQLSEPITKQDTSTLKAVIKSLPDSLPATTANALLTLASSTAANNNDGDELTAAADILPSDILDELQFIRRQMTAQGCPVGINLSDLGSYGYHSGVVFNFYSGSTIVARGGRYQPLTAPAANSATDSIAHPAVGFSIDLYRLPQPSTAPAANSSTPAAAVNVPMVGDDDAWREAVQHLQNTNRPIRFVAPDSPLTPPCLQHDSKTKRWQVQES